jgi:hypothetical protein
MSPLTCQVISMLPGGWNQIAVALDAQRVVDRFASLQGGTQYTGVGADRQRVTICHASATRCHQIDR